MSDWKNNLDNFFEKSKEKEVREEKPEFDMFVEDVVVPAFEKVAGSLREHGRFVTIRESDSSAAIIVTNVGEEEMTYRVQGRMFPNGVMPIAEVRFRERKGRRLLTVESTIKGPAVDSRLADITPEHIIRDFVDNYTRRVEI